MNIESFIKNSHMVGISPCEKYSCANVARCGVEKLACGAFKQFVSNGRCESPYTDFTVPRKRHEPRVFTEEIVVSRQMYERAMES